MHSRGIKRKLCDSGVAAVVGEERVQRQCLLDMSLVKLQHCHTLAEPDLCRSVLIANTVRQIQEDMDQEHGSCQVVPDPFMVSCVPESPPPLLEPHVLCQNGHVLGQNGSLSCQNGNLSCQNSNVLCQNRDVSYQNGNISCQDNSDASCLNRDVLCPSGGVSCRPPCGAAEDHQNPTTTYDLCPEEEESSYCWGRAELKMMGHALLEEAEAAALRPRCILGRGDEEEDEDDEVFLGKSSSPSSSSSSSSSPSSGGGSNPGLEEFLSDVEASYYDLDTMAIGMATPTTLTELDHIMEIIVGS